MKKKTDAEKIAPKCEYCAYGRLSPDKETVLCEKKGVVERDGHCRKYKYDILKREPRRPRKLQSFSEEDFSL
ncbi:MAG TPA: hypothetical protein IAB30_04185 [Candidatus Fimenecus excrementavium]|nr:hypothetical protein [Candidatus Fimenecus excrementavium]